MSKRQIRTDVIQQADIAVLALEIANHFPNNWASVSDIKSILMNKFDRYNETGDRDPFDQVIGNLICNRKTKRSIFSMGYAKYVDGGIEVTPEGQAFLETVPH